VCKLPSFKSYLLERWFPLSSDKDGHWCHHWLWCPIIHGVQLPHRACLTLRLYATQPRAFFNDNKHMEDIPRSLSTWTWGASPCLPSLLWRWWFSSITFRIYNTGDLTTIPWYPMTLMVFQRHLLQQQYQGHHRASLVPLWCRCSSSVVFFINNARGNTTLPLDSLRCW
jgi:hypothetical protein